MALPSRRSACLLLLLYDYFVFFFLISAFLFYLSRFVFHVISPLFFLSFLRLCFYFIFTQISSFSHSTKSIFLLRIFISVPLYIISIISFMCLLFFYSVTNLSPHLSTCVDVCFLVCLRACSSNPRFICLWPFSLQTARAWTCKSALDYTFPRILFTPRAQSNPSFKINVLRKKQYARYNVHRIKYTVIIMKLNHRPN